LLVLVALRLELRRRLLLGPLRILLQGLDPLLQDPAADSAESLARAALLEPQRLRPGRSRAREGMALLCACA